MDLDALADRMAACAGVIGVDSGLSHIAVALDLPHVQIYNFADAPGAPGRVGARLRPAVGRRRPAPSSTRSGRRWQPGQAASPRQAMARLRRSDRCAPLYSLLLALLRAALAARCTGAAAPSRSTGSAIGERFGRYRGAPSAGLALGPCGVARRNPRRGRA